jgi:hypothetical protein
METKELIADLKAWVDLQRGRDSELAEMLQVSIGLVRDWLAGRKVPTAKQQSILQRMLTMQKVFRCAHPVFEDLDQDGLAYVFSGSSFVIEFENRLFLITAKHVRELIMNATAVRIWVGGHYSLPFNRESIPQSSEPEADFVILEIDRDHLDDDQRSKLYPIRLGREVGMELGEVLAGAKVAIYGFPKQLVQINYSKQKITPKGYSVDGFYECVETTSRLHRVRFFNVKRPVTDHKGMSGSPWIIEKCSFSEWDYALVGLHVRGNQEIAFFVGVDILLAALKKIVAS